jgi:hypothetical protein
MKDALISRVELTTSGELVVTPVENARDAEELYPWIWRMGTEAFWDKARCSFVLPIPEDWSPEWSLAKAFDTITLSALSELGVRLVVYSSTKFVNVPSDLKSHIETSAGLFT